MLFPTNSERSTDFFTRLSLTELINASIIRWFETALRKTCRCRAASGSHNRTAWQPCLAVLAAGRRKTSRGNSEVVVGEAKAGHAIVATSTVMAARTHDRNVVGRAVPQC